MKRWLVGITAAAAVAAGAAGAYAQDRGGPGPFMRDRVGPARGATLSPEDRAAFTDARIAALHAGLKLNPEQEKLWPPVEAAIRGLVKERQDARAAARERFASMRDESGPRDIPAMLRAMGDRQAASAEALHKLADATGPLYAALDDGQKRRLAVLSRSFRPGMAGPAGPHRRWHDDR